jgi:homoserine O-acetyltransferase
MRLALLLLITLPLPAAEGDYIIKDFRFKNGETIAELRLHYHTLGTLNAAGTNAVLIMHGTGGSGGGFLRPQGQFVRELFGPGQLLDAEKYFIVSPDAIGHGRSSKPSDGLRAKFPKYDYDDMVLAQYRVLTEKLGVKRLRLVMGTSMGGMHTWVWGYTYPDFMDALMPLASLPVEIAGRNRFTRAMAIQAIKNDPAWQDGEYKTPPVHGLTTAIAMLLMMTSAPHQWQRQYPTREAADKFVTDAIAKRVPNTDANDFLYQFDASRNYNPQPHLEKIKAPLTAINSADDAVNPPELGILEREIKRVAKGKAIVLPISEQTRGHGTHSLPALWKAHLWELLERSK